MAESPYQRAHPSTYDRSAPATSAQQPPHTPYHQAHQLPPPRPHSRGGPPVASSTPTSQRPPPPPPPSHVSPHQPHHERSFPPSTGSYSQYSSGYPAPVSQSPGYPYEKHPPLSPSSSSPPGSATAAYSKGLPIAREQEVHRNSMETGPYLPYHTHEMGHPPPPGHQAPMPHEAPGYPHLHQPPPPAGGYAPYGYDPYGGQDGALRKKAARATQACDQCRKKKAKCDEARPSCTNCRQNNLQCNYAQSAPPKQDRTLYQLSEQVQLMYEGYESFKREMRNEIRGLRDQYNTTSHTPSATTTPLDRQHHSSFRFDGQPDRSLYQWKSEEDGLTTYMAQNGCTGILPPGTHLPLQHVNEEKSVDMLGGQASIPPEHTTAAHHLLSWKTIAPFYEKVTDNDYVRREELARVPLIQVAGKRRMRAQPDRQAPHPGADSPAANSDRDDMSTLSASESRRSAPTHTIPYVGGTRTWPQATEEIGDRETGRRLLNSFLDRIHLMHPFIHAGYIKELVERFFAVQSNPAPKPSEPSHPSRVDSASDAATAARNPKRKRSDDGSHHSLNDGATPTSRRFTTESIDPTIENALVCLVFALGKISEHHSSLAPYFTPLEQIGAGANAVPPADLSYSYKSPSPGTPLTSRVDKSRSPNSGSASSDRNFAFEPIDIDRVPGMGFYRRAAAIMGELRGGNELADIQACLLAGLYMAQLVRVRESWDWINEACQKCGLLLEHTDFQKTGRQPQDSIRMVYWTCIQFEGDLLAELDFLPNSHLSRFSEQIKLPSGQDCEREHRASEITMIYYSAQAKLRQILDRIHSSLYNVSQVRSDGVGWSSATAEDILHQLDSWKDVLPPILQWDEEHPTPAKDINTCRLRAKYYGARYVALRPFFQIYIHEQLHKHPLGTSTTSEGSETISDGTRNLLTQSLKCAKAAIQSTIAFDGMETMCERLVVTNIWGTAHAQFGNMLVLAAANMHGLRWLVSDMKLDELMNRTLTFLRNLAPLSPTMYTDLKVLENTQRIVLANRPATDTANASFSA